MDTSIISSVNNNKTFNARKVYLEYDPIEDNSTCSQCLLNLKYFQINEDESIFKCQMENCWFPYRKFIYKNSTKNLFYFYEPILINSNINSPSNELNNLLDIELNNKINDLKVVDSSGLDLINELDYLISELSESDVIKTEANLPVEPTKKTEPKRLTRCKEVIKNTEKLINENLQLKKQTNSNKNLNKNILSNSSNIERKLTTNLITKFKNDNLLNIIKKEKNKMEKKRISKMNKLVIKAEDKIVIPDNVDSVTPVETVIEIKPKECLDSSDIDLSGIDFNLMSDVTPSNNKEINHEKSRIQKKEELDLFSYNENPLFYEINNHLDDNHTVSDSKINEKDNFDFNSLFLDEIPVHHSVELTDNLVKIEENSSEIPELLPDTDKKEELVLNQLESNEKPMINMKKQRKLKSKEQNMPMRRSTRVRTLTK